MDELPLPKRKPGPSHLRNEIRQESTDDDRETEQNELQIFNTDTNVEAQPECDANKANDEDDFPLSPSSRAMLARNAISKGNSTIGTIPFKATYLEWKAFGARPEPSTEAFAFRPGARYTASKTSPNGEGLASCPLHVKTAAQLPPEVALNVGPESGLRLKFSPLTDDKQSEQIEARQSERSVLSKPTEVIASIEPEEKHVENEITKTESAAMASLVVHDPSDDAPGTLSSAESGRASTSVEKRVQKLDQKVKKSRKLQHITRRRMIWPPRINSQPQHDTSQDECAVDNEGMTHVTPKPSADIESSTNGASLNITSEPVRPSSLHGTTPIVPGGPLANSYDKHVGDHHTSEVELQFSGTSRSCTARDKGVPKVTQHSSPEAAYLSASQNNGSSRIAKQRRQTRSHRSILSSSPRPSGRPGFAVIPALDLMFDNLREAVYAESNRISEFHAAQAKTQSGSMSALQDTIDLQKYQINALQTEQKELRTKARDQIDKSNRYVKGIQNDYHKLKEAAKVHHETCSSALEQEFAEVRKEKLLMERDFRVTLDAVEKSQKSMKNTIGELFHSLQLSEAKKRDLIDIIKLKDQLYEDERAKRVQLEEQVLTSMHSLQQLLLDNNGIFLEKLGNFQTSLGNLSADEKRDACIQDCLDALKAFKETNILGIKDVQKAEKMLQIFHESVNAQFGELSTMTVANKSNFSVEFQSLKSALLAYEDFNATFQQTCKSNGYLSSQLDAEKTRCLELEETIRNLRQSEVELHSRFSQLETQLHDFKTRVRDLESAPSELEWEVVELRSQLKKAEEDCCSAVIRLQEAEHLRETEESRATEFEKMADAAKTKLTEIAQITMEVKKRMKKEIQDLRHQLNKDNEKALQEKEAAWANDFHRVSRELEDKEKLLQKMTEECNATKSLLLDVQQQFRSAEVAAKTPVNEDSKSAEAVMLRDELKQKSEDFQTKLDEMELLQRTHAELQAKATILQESVDQANAQLSEQRHLTEKLRADVDARANEVSSLRHIETSTTEEKRALQKTIFELHAAKETIHQKLHDTLEQAVEERGISDNYRIEIGDLKSQLEQSRVELNRSQAARERLAQEHIRNREAYEKVTKEKMQEKFVTESVAYRRKVDQHMEEVIAALRRQLTKEKSVTSEGDDYDDVYASQIQAPEPVSTNRSTTPSVRPSSQARLRKKVSRQSNTVLSVDICSSPQPSTFSKGLANLSVQPQRLQSFAAHLDLASPSTIDELGAQEQLDEGVSLHQFPEGRVSETQLDTFDTEDFSDLLLSQAPSSSQGTSQENMEQSTSGFPLGSRCGGDRSPLKEVEANTWDTRPCGSFSGPSVSSVTSRPRSQANTGSRMIPPAPWFLDIKTQSQSTSLNAPLSSSGKRKYMFDNTFTTASSPDFLHDEASSITKLTYTHHQAAKLSSSATQHHSSTPMAAVETPSRKRECSAVLNESGSRTELSNSLPPQSFMSPCVLSQAPPTSRMGHRSQNSIRASQSVVQGSTTRGSAPRRTKNHRYDFRFRRESDSK